MGNTTIATYVMPDVTGMTNLQAALAYAEAGMYVVPTKYGAKNPGSVVGKQWPALSTVDPAQIEEWWGANPRYGIALHCGKSGLIVFDVDDPDKVPEEWFDMLAAAPANGTRTAQKSKGHYFFRMPPGRSLSNSLGRLPRGWGDVRGANGVVILPPSTHPGQIRGAAPKDKGGKYYQRRGGVVPYLPPAVADMMAEAKPGEYALTDKELQAFVKFNHAEENPKLVKNVVRRYEERVEAGESRHTSAVEALCWAFREVRAGMYSAQRAIDEVSAAFRKSLQDGSGAGDEREAGAGEWQDIVRWAASQAQSEDPEKIRKEIADRKKNAQAAREKSDLYRPGPGCVTDQDHARAIIRWIAPHARYAKDAASWVLNDGKQWIVSPSTKASSILALVADYMPEGSKPEDEDAGEWSQANWDYWHKQRYETSRTAGAIASKIDAIVTSRRSEDIHTINLSGLDTDPTVLWTPSGPIDLTGKHGPAWKKEQLGTVHLHCTAYDPQDVPTPRWDALMAAVWPDPAVRAWAMQLFAVGVTGYSPKLFLFLHGEKDRGKTSVPTLIANVLGTYARDDISAGIVSSDAQPWDKAALHGLRFGLIDEAPSWSSRPTEELKKITGGAEISAAYKGKQPFKFAPTHTLAFSSNPEPSTTDPAVVGRMRALPCTGRVAAVRAARRALGRVDGAVWQQEAPGVLHQLLELARKFVLDEMVVDEERTPAVIKRSMVELKREQNLLEEWLDAHTSLLTEDISKKEWATAQEIYDEFSRWCTGTQRGKNYLKPANTVRWLGKQLSNMAKRKGYVQKSYGNSRVWNVNINPARVKNR